MPRGTSRCLWFTFASTFFSTVLGQATHTVVMGVAGSFYDPPTVAAQEGDTVTFIFGNGFHGVTQCTFEAPCVRAPGGFNSGLISALNTSDPIKQWSLTITNASQPIWFFCEATRPESHCAAGMVGVINPPSIPMFQSFQSAAKAVTGTPVPTPTLILSGIGAFATASPSAPPGALPPSATASSTTSDTPPPTVTATAAPVRSSSNVNIGGVVGGTVGGVVVLAIIAILGFLLYRSNRKQRKQQKQFDSTHHESYQDHPQFTVYPQSPQAMSQPQTSDYFGGGPPVRNSTLSPAAPQSSQVNRQHSVMSSVSNPYYDNSQRPMPAAASGPSYGPQVDVQHLAREVAALMGQQQNQSGGRISPPSTDASAPRRPSAQYSVANPGQDDSPPVYKS